MGKLIAGENVSYSTNCYETQLTNNLLVVGATGSGKSRSIIGPNIVECNGSQIIFDPKGALYKIYATYLKQQGYLVRKLDFTNPRQSCHYNPLSNIRTTQDVLDVAHTLVYSTKGVTGKDPFWDQSAEQLLSALIAFVCGNDCSDRNMKSVITLLDMMSRLEEYGEDAHESPLDSLFEGFRGSSNAMKAFAHRCYCSVNTNPIRTLRCIITSLSSKLTAYSTKEIEIITSKTDFDICTIGKKKTAFFVVCSDARGEALDKIVQLFFTQTMNRLVDYADNHCENQSLPVPVQFIMDDFACGVSITDIQKKIAIIRSRNISICIAIQAIQQLADMYGKSAAKTILSNFDTTVFMGTNDYETCFEYSRRANKPIDKILDMPLGYSWVFRRGNKPLFTKNAKPVDLDMLAYNKNIATKQCHA